MKNPFQFLGAVFAGLAVAAGAFGAHGLEGAVTPDRLEVWKTAANYQMVHALGLLFLSLLSHRGAAIRWAGYAFLAGIVLFSGSLYLLVLTDTGWLGAITPLGGLAFLAGWVLLAIEGCRKRCE